jgi:imidazolonepropionase-like amidohydrolase
MNLSRALVVFTLFSVASVGACVGRTPPRAVPATATTPPPSVAAAPVLSPSVKKYVRVDAPRIVLAHIEVIDGTGASPRPDQNVVLEGGKIVAIVPGADETAAGGTTVLDLRGHAVLPGIVGMHDHLWFFARPHPATDGSFERPAQELDMTYSAPRLYLANGVTTIRTAGSKSPYEDLRVAVAIERGKVPGPHMDVTGPYLDHDDNPATREPSDLSGPDDARRTVAFWADRGVTSFKAYVGITRAELAAAAGEAHRRGYKVLGHLCSVTYEEAVEAGIDSLEHGFFGNTALDPGKKPDACSDSHGEWTLEQMAPGSDEAKRLITLLVRRHVAVTSTLVSTAAGVPGAPPVRPEALDSMTPEARQGYLFDRDRKPRGPDHTAEQLRRDMDLERAFVAAGGLLMAGADSVGLFGSVPGFANHREIELLVEAGFTPVEAIRIATYNGAAFLGRQEQIGSVAVGKNADLVVVKGDPASRIVDIEEVAIVFKDGVGYDRQKLLDAVKGHYGEY